MKGKGKSKNHKPSFTTNAGAAVLDDLETQDLVSDDSADVTTNEFQTLKISVDTAVRVRHELLEGRNYTVVPMVMLTEGVHAGSNGPLYYPPEELSKTPAVWNHKPIVVYHPVANGTPISACAPAVISRRKVGIILNAKYIPSKGKNAPGKLVAEAWLETNRLPVVDKRVAEAVANKEMMEVSTGLYTDNEHVDGRWGKENYSSIARNYRPDHLAILPDEVGACSMKDGAGLMRNSASHGETRDKLHEMIRSRRTLPSGLGGSNLNDGSWVRDVYDTFCIYSCGGKMFKQNYTNDEAKGLSLSGSPVEVTAKQTYQTKDGKTVNTQGANMAKPLNSDQIVDLLIENSDTPFTEDNRDFLANMELDEVGLIGINAGIVHKNGQDYVKGENDDDGDQNDELKDAKSKVKAKKAKSSSTDTMNKDDGPEPDKRKGKEKGRSGKEDADDEDDTPTGKGVRNQREEEDTPMTLQEYVDAAPEEIQEVLTNSIRTMQRAKRQLVAAITANKACRFTKDQLMAKDVNELELLHSLAGGPQTNRRNPAGIAHNATIADYSGMGDVEDSADDMTQNEEQEVLEIPTLNFKREGKQPARANNDE